MNLRQKVFGIGLNKTGTTSLAMALRILGSQSHASCDLALVRHWSRGNIQPILEAARKHQTFEDWPWPLVYRELHAEFPDARFILTTRSSEEIWFDSLCSHAQRTGPTEFRKLIYGNYMPDGHKDEHIAIYRRHSQEVLAFFQESAPEQILLVCWENGDGWDALCRFLGCPIPQQDFPHLNRDPQYRGGGGVDGHSGRP